MEANSPEMEELISSFIKITSSSREVAISCLETRQWNLNDAVSTFRENEIATAEILRLLLPSLPSSHLSRGVQSARSEESSFERQMITQGVGNIDLSADISGETGNRSDEKLDQNKSGDVNRNIARPGQSSRSSAEHQEEYMYTITGWREGEAEHTYTTTIWRNISSIINSLFLTLDPPVTNIHEIMSGLEFSIEFDPAHFQVKVIRREQEYYGRTETPSVLGAPPSMMSKKRASSKLQEQQQQEQQYPLVTLIVTIWKNGFTVGDSPLMSLDDPQYVALLETFIRMESLGLLGPARTRVSFRRRGADSSELPSFQGVRRTLAKSDSVCTEPQDLASSPSSLMGSVIVDQAAPTTTIQLRLADGRRIVTQFNTHQTVRDVRDFIDAYSKDYQLLIMGSPPTLLSDDFNQTIEEAGIANSVLIQKF